MASKAADTPRKTAARRQAAKAEAIKAIQSARQNGRISFDWRVVGAAEAGTNEGWISWRGQIVAVHRDALEEESVTGLLVRYDEDCEDLVEALQHFPPVPDLMEVTDLFEVKGIIVAPPRARGLAQPKLSPYLQQVATESRRELPPRPPPTPKRPRVEENDVPEGTPPPWFLEFAKQQASINESLLGRVMRPAGGATGELSTDDDDFDESSELSSVSEVTPKARLSKERARMLTATRVAKARAKTRFVAPNGDTDEGILVPLDVVPLDEVLYPHRLITLVKDKGVAEAYNQLENRFQRMKEECTPLSGVGTDIFRLLMLQLRALLKLAAVTKDCEELQLLVHATIASIVAQFHVPQGAESTTTFVELIEAQLTKKTLDVSAAGFKPSRRAKKDAPPPKKHKAENTKKTAAASKRGPPFRRLRK